MKKIFVLFALLFSLNLHSSQCGFYVYGGGGISNSHNIEAHDIYPGAVPSAFDSNLVAANLTGSANAGLGYNINQYLGIQGNFTYWGDQDYGVNFEFPGAALIINGGSRTYSFGVDAVGYLPLACNTINPFVKVGYARFHSDWRFASNTGISIDEFPRFTNRGNGLVFGAGIAFAVTPCFDVTFQSQWLFTDSQRIILNHVTLQQYSVNLVYHLGNLFW